ncbi:helix-turn-helix transcriptional regulator [Sphingomonas lenta]|uniref:Helix-turn-helix transcriptional regulator n=1 Tax=Sphingomonas lenta TaxID=1141887 RepID=A0A2A2SCM6_9SPHN|nr:helix-turn-helix transcriptional regulator [Sphingomonas lenta]PAX06955.1 helix-turn-helix transcriptional regulator [Sphingomonas lenta]
MNALTPPALSEATLGHLRQLVDGLSAGVILVHPSGTILWANPAALAMHGVTAPEEIGATADDYCQRFCLRYRNHHRLPRREYPIMRLLAGESFPDLVVEVAPLGQNEPRWVHHVRDVQMDDDGGEPDCLALVIQDVSDRFEAEDRFDAMFGANPAPALIVRLSDHRYIKANRGFLELSGFSRDAVIGRSLLDIGVLDGAERAGLAKRKLEAGETIPQMEAELPTAAGPTRLVILAGQPIELADQPCMLLTFADLEPRRRAEQALKRSEEHFEAVFRMAPVPMLITEAASGRIVDANDAFGRMTAFPAGTVSGEPLAELPVWGDAAERDAILREIGSRGGLRGRDMRLLDRQGRAIDCLLSAERICRHGTECVVWLFQDITARRHSELELADAMEAVMKDASWFSRTVMEKLAELRNPRGTGAIQTPVDLSVREKDVAHLIGEGLDDGAIAERLGLSRNTVRNHVARLYGKIGVNKRSAAVVWARERGY